jgi:hypothetical protein
METDDSQCPSRQCGGVLSTWNGLFHCKACDIYKTGTSAQAVVSIVKNQFLAAK